MITHSPSLLDNQARRLVIETVRKQYIDVTTNEVESVAEEERSYFISFKSPAQSQTNQDLNPATHDAHPRSDESNGLCKGSVVHPATKYDDDEEEEEGAWHENDKDISSSLSNRSSSPQIARGRTSQRGPGLVKPKHEKGQLTKTQKRRLGRLKAEVQKQAGPPPTSHNRRSLASRITDHWRPKDGDDRHKHDRRWHRDGRVRAAQHWSPGRSSNQRNTLREWNDNRYAVSRPRSASPPRRSSSSPTAVHALASPCTESVIRTTSQAYFSYVSDSSPSSSTAGNVAAVAAVAAGAARHVFCGNDFALKQLDPNSSDAQSVPYYHTSRGHD